MQSKFTISFSLYKISMLSSLPLHIVKLNHPIIIPEINGSIFKIYYHTKEKFSPEITNANTNIVQAAMASVYGSLIYSTTRIPVLKEVFIDTLDRLDVKVTKLDAEEVQIARAAVLEYLYEGITRQPDLKNDLTGLFEKYLGGIVDINYYTLTFNANGGTAVDKITTYYNTTITKPADPQKDGFNFLGWYNGETLFDFDTPITKNLTLTAKWANKIVYPILEGDDQTVTMGSNKTITFRAKGDFTKFKALYRNGALVEAENYTTEAGSVIITLKADYVKTLPIGNHTFTILYTDGEATVNLTVKAELSPTSLKIQQMENLTRMKLLTKMKHQTKATT